jgi:hypothetical protein
MSLFLHCRMIYHEKTLLDQFRLHDDHDVHHQSFIILYHYQAPLHLLCRHAYQPNTNEVVQHKP